MRFHEHGPLIPDNLLREQEEGNVVFLCGAGVSRKAGMPDFKGLTIDVAKELGAVELVENLEKGNLINPPLDQVFKRLSINYGKDVVDFEVTKLLRTDKKPNLKHHKSILDLSIAADGKPRLVTTNFDLLFEAARPGLKLHLPPQLPDLSSSGDFNGIVYLHGRLAEGDITEPRSYVIDSSDFGRAYMAEGWATKFIKDLQSNFSIVIIGYSADDPPMRYLLDGLASSRSNRSAKKIYAFCEGRHAEDWESKGVVPLIFDTFDDLWKSVISWGKKASDENQWVDRIINKSQKSPLALKPYERGQVVNFVLREDGAAKFSQQEMPPPSEWLCVFDAYQRYTIKNEISGNRIYELDDDPIFDQEALKKPNAYLGRNVLFWNGGDEVQTKNLGLGFWNKNFVTGLPLRLQRISAWISRVINEPFAVWWASGRETIHPDLCREIRIQLPRKSLGDQVSIFWRYYLEAQNLKSDSGPDIRWVEFVNDVKTFGWCVQTLNTMRAIFTPLVNFSPPKYVKFKRKASLKEYRNLLIPKVVLPTISGEKLEIPEYHLLSVIRQLRQTLETVSRIKKELGIWAAKMHTLLPDGSRSENHYASDEVLFRWLAELFDRLCKFDKAAALRELQGWDYCDRTYFARLLLFNFTKSDLVSPLIIGDTIWGLSVEVFWDPYLRRELLHALKTNWSGFTDVQREKILTRILAGHPKYRHLSALEHKESIAFNAVKMICWLAENGCAIHSEILNLVNGQKATLKEWRETWIKDADRHWDGVSGWVVQDTNPSALLDVPISDIVAVATKESARNHGELRETLPFTGLVKCFPVKAFSALRSAAKGGVFPGGFWISFLNAFSKNDNSRFVGAINAALQELSDHDFDSIIYGIINWLEKSGPILLSRAPKKFFVLVSRLITALKDSETENIRSNLTYSGIMEDKPTQSEVSYGKAINSKGGRLANCLSGLLGNSTNPKDSDKDVLSLLASLIAVENLAGHHAICEVASKFDFYFYHFKDWLEKNILPKLKVADPKAEACWHGIAANNSALDDRAFISLREDFLNVVHKKINFQLDDDAEETIFQILVLRTLNDSDSPSCFSYQQTRQILKSCNEKMRNAVIDQLTRYLSKNDDWHKVIKPFLQNAWPREKKYISQYSSRALMQLADNAKEEFPDIALTILPLLMKTEYLHSICFRYYAVNRLDNALDVARLYPKETLFLLNAVVPDERHLQPYALRQTLDAIADGDPALKRSTEWKRLYKSVS